MPDLVFTSARCSHPLCRPLNCSGRRDRGERGPGNNDLLTGFQPVEIHLGVGGLDGAHRQAVHEGDGGRAVARAEDINLLRRRGRWFGRRFGRQFLAGRDGSGLKLLQFEPLELDALLVGG